MELFSPRRLKATQITRKLVGVEDVPHRGLKPWKLGGKLRMLLCRISKVHKLLPEKIVERALDAKSPFNAAGRPTLLYPDLVKLYAAHAATIKAGLSRAQKTARFPWHDPSATCISVTAYTSFLSGHLNAHGLVTKVNFGRVQLCSTSLVKLFRIVVHH